MTRKSVDFRIRMAEPEEAATIASILYEAFSEYRSSYTHQAFTATTLTSDQVYRRMDEGPIWVAMRGETIVGTVSGVSWGEDFYIRSLAVLSSARSQGIGGMLMRSAEKFAQERGHKRLILNTTPFLTAAIRLYENLGFQFSSEGAQDLFGTPLLKMVKVLEQ